MGDGIPDRFGTWRSFSVNIRFSTHSFHSLYLSFSLPVSLVSYYFALTSIEWFPVDSVWHIEKVFLPHIRPPTSFSPSLPIANRSLVSYNSPISFSISFPCGIHTEPSIPTPFLVDVSSVFHMRWLYHQVPTDFIPYIRTRTLHDTILFKYSG